MLKLSDIHFSYAETQVLKGINLDVRKGEIISIVGASGAGKTTLLHILGTLEKAKSGNYLINDKSVLNLNPNELSKFRNLEIGFIFQFHNLLVEFSAFENICLPGYISDSNKIEVENRALELLNILGISDKKDNKPNELSGGEQQRVAIARALINSPSIILADEPSGNLDSKNADNLHELILKLNKELNQTFIIVTHNNELAAMTDRTLKMVDGKFIQ
ncbi:MAG: ABC transporter ATP-binding protein [Flavobacteriales bacterium]